MMKILVINCGSSSLKYQLFDMEGEKVLAKGICESIATDMSHTKGSTFDGRGFDEYVDIPDHKVAFNIVKDALTTGDCKVIDSLTEISAIGHRVVQGGDIFTESVLIDDSVLKAIDELSALAPLHNPAHVVGIECCNEVFGASVPQVAVFDNAFHSTMPATSYIFPIPYKYYEEDHIRRYGAHGTSHRFVAYRTAEIVGKDLKDIKLITCHLGNGCSITAIKDGKVLDTSMGLTPLDGFAMGTRCGGIDPSVVTYIMQKHNISPAEMDKIMNKQSGVLGVSGVHSDDRAVKAAAAEGNERAKLARDIQWYQIRKYIGSYIAAMDGVDVIAFTGGIGENCIDLREDVLSNLSYLGIKLNKEANEVRGEEIELTEAGCPVRAFVVPTNEELAIARDTKAICEKL
jgi:acetate kinase